jgi:mRNA-degrading endonuclease RelE of RelBE toxin-antitoxin system
MEVNWHPEALDDLRRFEEQVQNRITRHVRRLENGPFGEDTSLFSKQGLDLFRLKLKTDELDHRIFFDLEQGDVVILGVEHRDDAYTAESIENIKSRT